MKYNIKIGVTIDSGANNNTQTLWGSGIGQNIIYLGLLLEKLTCVSEVYLVSCSLEGQINEEHPVSKLFGIPSMGINDAITSLDIIVELGVRLPTSAAFSFRQAGGKLVSYVAGNVMVMNLESVSSRRDIGEVVDHVRYDAVWITPQHMRTNYSYCKKTRSDNVFEVPHIWDSAAIRNSRANYRHPYSWKPLKEGEKWKIAVFEPNVNFIKTFHFPLLVCENAERTRSDLIGHVFLMNTLAFKGQLHFEEFVSVTDLFKHGKITAEGRMPVVEVMNRHANAVVAHQWENALNYSYWDVLYGSFPLIHNSDEFKDVGYYYPEFDPVQGGQILINALLNHEKNIEQYKTKVNTLLWRFSIDNPVVQSAHFDLIQSLYVDDKN